ncbi:ankyrin repeat, SAM and basic leucine zipper domain-containing protein 1 [Latimeria chalumnae]|uniref:ankyrin repeat, SAM and basic leucine zipper domain-containing protein 1 n=1 Tax=Latimeria chalumnae TaxID=7897 RepID=UPI0006D8EE27|nr:PREDICTED: ankyrin repeat, SAM and basic leucine zipper domain-containing protein 1 isoform X2 [Latimeria chalumnae]|eukprot:XP_014344246.1 PREDICTED: ankyrin repeat, SAM and basic leucine zipper domain-containing protein 1 isoform X2 [Latimeria chalumnae]
MAMAVQVFAAGEESGDSDDGWDISAERKPPKTQQLRKLLVENKDDALKKALTSGDVHAVKELINAGINVESRFQFGWTPLMYAANVAHLELIQILLDRGANASFAKDQYTVLMAACTARAPEEKVVKCVELLLSRNANPNVANSQQMTPLMFAARDGRTQVVILFVAHGAEVNAQDLKGYTALTWAAHNGHKSTVLKLAELGADASLKTKDGKTPADIANKKKHSELSALLALTSNPMLRKSHNISKEETICKYLKTAPDPVKDFGASLFGPLNDLELFLHGLELEHLTKLLKDNEVSVRYLLTMEKEDLEKVGITDPADQKKILDAIQDLHVEEVKFGKLPQLVNFDCSDELLNFLTRLKKQCNGLAATVQNIADKMPTNSHEIVLEWDSSQNCNSVCDDLICAIKDLDKEVVRLRSLLQKQNQAQFQNGVGVLLVVQLQEFLKNWQLFCEVPILE